EWILKWPSRRANGGGVVLLRTLWVSSILFALALWSRNKLDPTASIAKDAPQWFGVIFAAGYTGFYTRFSSQWNYIAGLYNQIKSTEALITTSNGKATADTVLVSWKAGFIEDAYDLHLALKPMYAMLIQTWLEHETVRSEFTNY